jgi:hypothetical protein
MLTLYHNSQEIVLDTTEYYVRELASGLDEVIFDLSIWDPNYALIAEEANIVDRGGQRYLVKQIDAGAVTAKIVCQLDLDDWRASMAVGYDSGSKTVAQQISAVCPAGWSVLDKSGSSISRTLHGDYTPLQVCEACRDVYSVYIRWDNKIKRCTIYSQTMGSPAGSFATRELNLKEINYKGKSNNFITRLYAYGKDGLSFADINSGKAYVDNNTYSNRIICGYWQDDRYTVKQNLLDDAREKLAKLAVPERSYDCAIVDLQATNPSMYGNLSFELFTVATLIDDSRDTAINYQVVERHAWPYHPDRNDVIFNSSPVKIQNSVVQIEDEIINPNSTFSQIWANRVQEATQWMTKGGGYLIALQDPTGTHWTDLLAMDTDDLTTATDVLRINMNGIGFSHNGVNSPYASAWTIDGEFNADFILGGHMSANRIQAGVLESTATTTVGGVQVPVTQFNLDTGKLVTYDGEFKGSITCVNSDSTKSTTITAGKITTNDIDITGGSITLDSYNYWNLSTGAFRVGGPSATAPHISLASRSAGAAFEIYADANNYWNLKTGAFKTNNGSFTGSITASTFTSTAGDYTNVEIGSGEIEYVKSGSSFRPRIARFNMTGAGINFDSLVMQGGVGKIAVTDNNIIIDCVNFYINKYNSGTWNSYTGYSGTFYDRDGHNVQVVNGFVVGVT